SSGHTWPEKLRQLPNTPTPRYSLPVHRARLRTPFLGHSHSCPDKESRPRPRSRHILPTAARPRWTRPALQPRAAEWLVCRPAAGYPPGTLAEGYSRGPIGWPAFGLADGRRPQPLLR